MCIVPLKYLSTRFSLIMALGPGLDMLFARTITECVMSGLVPLLRYRRDPVADRKYFHVLWRHNPFLHDIDWPRFSRCLRRARVSHAELVTHGPRVGSLRKRDSAGVDVPLNCIPRRKRASPRSTVSNRAFSCSMIVVTLFSSCPKKRMSSTYTSRRTPPSFRMYRHGSAGLWTNPISSSR